MVKKDRPMLKPKSDITGIVQAVQKTVKLPIKSPIPERDPIFNFDFLFLKTSTKPTTRNPVKRLRMMLNKILPAVKPAPITHIRSLVPGNLDIK